MTIKTTGIRTLAAVMCVAIPVTASCGDDNETTGGAPSASTAAEEEASSDAPTNEAVDDGADAGAGAADGASDGDADVVDDSDAAVDPLVAAVLVAFEEGGDGLSAVLNVDQDPIHPDFVATQAQRAIDALDPMLALLPADPGATDDPGQQEYARLRAALIGWRDHAVTVRAEVESGYDELLAMAEAWDRQSAPPMELTDPIDGHFEQWAPAVEAACAAFAVAVGVTPGCTEFRDAGPVDTAEAGPQQVLIGSVVFDVDPLFPVTDLGAEPDFAFFDYGPGGGSVTFLPPPRVADPAMAGPELSGLVPWPDDVAGWAAAAGLDVVEDRVAELGTHEWHAVHLRATDNAMAIMENRWHPEGAFVVDPSVDLEVVVWQSVVGGQPVVVVLEAALLSPGEFAAVVGDVDAVLATIDDGGDD